MAYIPTQIEREAFIWLQGRLVELLMRYDLNRFNHKFGQQTSDPDTLNDLRLEPYRRRAVLYYLHTELFDYILPRIKNGLSVSDLHHLHKEPLPARGRVDWTRTAAANWRERPGEVPLEVYARQRQRDFATAENLLTVLTLLEYREAARYILASEAASQALRHPLTMIIDSSERELGFPQFAGLVGQCQQILEGYSSPTVAELEQQIAARIGAGGSRNRAYADLLKWRQHLQNLKLRDRLQTEIKAPMLGADPAEDDYLYQVWLFYELSDLLQRENKLIALDSLTTVVRFKWGDPGSEVEYVLQHDRGILGEQYSEAKAIRQLPYYWHAGTSGKVAPGVRPDFYIWRSSPAAQKVIHAGEVIWHEPGYVLDAKYYRPQDSNSNHSGPLKRMIADLQLTSERYGALLFGFDNNVGATETEPIAAPSKRLYPRPELAQFIQPELELNVWTVSPKIAQNLDNLLHQLLEAVHAHLKQPVEISCQGIFLESLGATASGKTAVLANLARRDGTTLPANQSLEELLLCPKPHVGQGRVDIVSLKIDCYKNENGVISGSALCHIKEQAGLQTPQRLTSLEEIQKAFSATSEADTTGQEALVQAATQQAITVAKRYADLLKPNLAQYRQEVSEKADIGDKFESSPLLNEEQRNTLALGQFLYAQVKMVGSTNYASPALLFAGVLEQLTRTTIYRAANPPGASKDKERTLGGIAHFRAQIEPKISPAHWNKSASPLLSKFSVWVNNSAKLAKIRNHAAHEGYLPETEFKELLNLYFGGLSSGGHGLFNGLLLAWQA